MRPSLKKIARDTSSYEEFWEICKKVGYKEFSREEYEKILLEIIEDMQQPKEQEKSVVAKNATTIESLIDKYENMLNLAIKMKEFFTLEKNIFIDLLENLKGLAKENK